MITETIIHKLTIDRFKQLNYHKRLGEDVIHYDEIEKQVREEYIGKETEMSPVIKDMERLKEIQIQAIKGAEEAKQISEKYNKPLFKLFS